MNPILLLGTARSGTTFLGRTALSRADGLCYWGEPNHVWMHGNAYRRHDELTEADARPEVVRYIRQRFEERLAGSGGSVLLEKTPANCLRLPFIREVFPDARYIHLVRDGRAVVRSAMKEWLGQGGDARDSRELREGGSAARVGKGTRAYLKLRERVHGFRDLIELPAYSPRFGRFVLRNCFPGRDFFWGPRFRGIHAYRRGHSLAETCALQWRRQAEGMLRHQKLMSPDRIYSLRFEDLMADPQSQLEKLTEWMGVGFAPEVLEAIVGSVDARPSREQKHPLGAFAEEERSKVDAIIAPVQAEFGYR